MDNQNTGEKSGTGAILSICGFIVDKRNLFFLIFIILSIFSIFSKNWVGVENSLSFYLPQSTETKRGLDLMDQQFTTFGSAKLMIANVSYQQGEKIADMLEEEKGVFSATCDDSSDHYAKGSIEIDVVFDYDEDEPECLEALEKVKTKMADYDCYISTTLGDQESELLDEEMSVISVLVVIVVLTVLFLTTEAYMEIPVLLLTFGAGAVLHMGTNFVFGTISFVSDSVTIVLQLALSVDYAIILLNRYKEERKNLEVREAVIEALSKAIPEITGSSLTTVGGLVAMTFMQYQMGPDLGIVLIKSIGLSLLSVFLLMPGLIMLFSEQMEKTKHKNFIPKISFVGKYAYFTRFIVPPLFLAVIIMACITSAKTPYVFGDSNITAPKQNRVQKAEEMIRDAYGAENFVAVVFKREGYENEKKLVEAYEACPEVDHVQSLTNSEAKDGYCLTDKLTPRQFAETLDIEYDVALIVYGAYAIDDEEYARTLSGLSGYSVPLIDMISFLYDEMEEVELSEDIKEELEDANKMIDFARKQLESEEYSRILVYLNLPEEDEETYAFLDKMHTIGEEYYSDGVTLCGESVSVYDLKKTFARDNTVVSLVSIVVVLAVLLFTFMSAGMPVLLIAVIQGSIWINFSFPALRQENIFFMSYLIVTSIQMGANIDYAIVVAGRYTELRKNGIPRREAIIDSMNFAFPTIITSGTMMVFAGFLIGGLTSNPSIYGIGQCLGRGTVISIIIIMFVLPQILVLGDTIIEKTAFVMNMPVMTRKASGVIRVDGVLRGRINGTVIGTMHAIVRGDVSAYLQSGEISEIEGEDAEEEKEVGNKEVEAEPPARQPADGFDEDAKEELEEMFGNTSDNSDAEGLSTPDEGSENEDALTALGDEKAEDAVSRGDDNE